MTLETTLPDTNEQIFLYRFLVSSKFRIARHVLLFISLFVISVNLLYITYRDLIYELESWAYLIVLYILLTYLFVAYFNLYYLLPKYLLTGRYGTYIVLLLLSVVGVLMAQMFLEYIVCCYLSPASGQYSFLSMPVIADFISTFLLTVFCQIGGSLTVWLKLWMVNNRQVAQLEEARVSAEVERLKEQFSPALLFKTLRCAGQLALSKPPKASLMLTKLGYLLRYQVQDCKREEVYLRSVINYLTNFLMLEQFESERFEFVFSFNGEVNRTLVPPLLFIPFVQYAVERIYGHEGDMLASLNVRMEVDEEYIRFFCTCPGIDLSDGKGLERIRQRLALQYGERYRLELTGESIRLTLEKGGVI